MKPSRHTATHRSSVLAIMFMAGLVLGLITGRLVVRPYLRSSQAGSVGRIQEVPVRDMMERSTKAPTIDPTASLCDQFQQVVQIVPHLSASEFRIFASELKNIPYRNRWMAHEVLFESWAKTDPQEAMNYIKEQGAGYDLSALMVMTIWGKKNPEHAIRFILNGDHPIDDEPYLLVPACKEMSFTQPQTILKILPEMRESSRVVVVGEIIKILLHGNPRDATDAWTTLPRKDQAKMLDHLVREWQKFDSEAATFWLSQVDPEIKNEAQTIRDARE